MTPKIVPGRPDPLGATPDVVGTNFAVASGGHEVSLCLFEADGAETQLVMPDRDGDVWHGFVAGVGPGRACGFQVSGPFDPGRGLRYNPAKLLLDPTHAQSRATCGSGRKSSLICWKTHRRQALWTQPSTSGGAWFVPCCRPSPYFLRPWKSCAPPLGGRVRLVRPHTNRTR